MKNQSNLAHNMCIAPHRNILSALKLKLFILVLICFYSLQTKAQFNYTHESIDPSSLTFTYTDNIVTQRFTPTGNISNDGFVTFRPGTYNGIENLIIELLDEQEI